MPVMPGAAIQGAKITGPSNERVDMFRLQVCYIMSCEIPKLLRLKSTFFWLNDGKCHVFLAGEIQRFVPGPASHLCGAEKTAEPLALAQAQGTEPWAYTKGMGLM